MDKFEGLIGEKEEFGYSWDQYVLWLLEVDRDEVNEDGLFEVAEALHEWDAQYGGKGEQ